MAMGSAAAVAVALLVWAMRPASPTDPPPDSPSLAAPSATGDVAAEPPLATTPRGDAGALSGFQSPRESRPAGNEPAVVPVPGGVARPAPGAGTATTGAVAGTRGIGGGSRPGAATPSTTGAVPRASAPPPVSAPPLVSVTPSIGTANPPGGTGASPAGAAAAIAGTGNPTVSSVAPADGTSAGGSPAAPAGGNATPSPRVEAPVGRHLDETTITRLVNAFGQAYQSKDLQGLKAVWPEMRGSDENSYRNVFNSYRSINWVTGATNIRFDGERADARSAVQVTQRALRPDTTTTQSRTYRFQFERRAKGWVLTGVENLGVAR